MRKGTRMLKSEETVAQTYFSRVAKMRNYKLVISREHKDKQHNIWWYKTLADLFIVSYKWFKVNCRIWHLAMCKFAHYDWNYGKRCAVIYRKGEMRKTELNGGKLRGVRGVFLLFSCSCIIIVKSVLPTSLPLLPLSLTSFCFSIRHGMFSPFLRCGSLSLPLMFISSFACFTAHFPLLYWKWDRERNGICYKRKAPRPSIVCEQPCSGCASFGPSMHLSVTLTGFGRNGIYIASAKVRRLNSGN